MKKKNLLMCFLSVILILMTVLTGCGRNAQNTSTESTGSYEKLTLDNYGREVVIEAMPQKVLVFGPNSTELLLALGLGDKIIGNSYDNHSRGSLPEYAEAYAKIPELTYGPPTREAVFTSGADFIYGVDWPYGKILDVEELKKYGINVYMNRAKTLEKMYQEISDLGKIFHVEDKAAAFIADQQARITAVGKKIAGQKQLKVVVYDRGKNGVLTCGKTSFETYLIEKTGGKNIFDDVTEKEWFVANYEDVLKRDPDVMIIHDYDVPSLEEKIKEIKNDPTLSKLECVKNERFVPIMLESIFPGDRMAYSIEIFAKGFYPDLFK